MVRRSLSAIALALLALAPAAQAAVPQAPDVTDTRYASYIERIVPNVADVTWTVIDRNDELDLTNRSHETVTVYGYSTSDRNVSYSGGPYVRILGNGTVQVNEDSQAYYLNQSFFIDPTLLPHALVGNDTGYPEDWVTVARNSNFIWHDHRIHYTSYTTPKDVTNPHKKTFVQSWYVPIEVGSTRGYLYGKLYWLAQNGSSFPIAAIIALIAIVLAGAAFVIVVRRRRRAQPRAEAW